MLLRGTSHVLLSQLEIMKSLKHPAAVNVLRAVMEFYEVHHRRVTWESEGGTEVENIWLIEIDLWKRVIRQTQMWLAQPILLDFGVGNANKPRRNVNGNGGSDIEEINLSKAERRRRRRQRRKNNLNRV